jgi:hypothetical protein
MHPTKIKIVLKTLQECHATCFYTEGGTGMFSLALEYPQLEICLACSSRFSIIISGIWNRRRSIATPASEWFHIFHWILLERKKLQQRDQPYKFLHNLFQHLKAKLWGTASTSSIEILERFQSKALCMIVDAPWYVPNTVTRRHLQISAVTEEIRRYSSQYSALLSAHPNGLVVSIMV